MRSIPAKLILVLCCVAGVSVYVRRVVRVYVAQQAAATYRLPGLERAVQLGPDNAEFAHPLGLQLSEALQDHDRAIATLHRAAVLQPHTAQYWLDLASAYQLSANSVEQNKAIENALDAEPHNPDVAAEAAEYYLLAGTTQRALPLFRQALEQDPSAAADLLPACWRATHDAKLILEQVLPANPEARLAFLRVLTQQNETDAAQIAWEYLLAARQSFPPQDGLFYLDYLFSKHQAADLVSAWRGLISLHPELAAYLPNDNLIVNSGFEQPPLNAGLDWHYQPVANVTAGIDTGTAHSGIHSLGLAYDGNAAYDAGWQQIIPVQAGADYVFSAWVKSENTASSSGPRFSIVDAYTGAQMLLTDDILDTQPWHEMNATFHVPAGTELVALKIIRAPADTKIRGHVWIDDLRMVRK